MDEEMRTKHHHVPNHNIGEPMAAVAAAAREDTRETQNQKTKTNQPSS